MASAAPANPFLAVDKPRVRLPPLPPISAEEIARHLGAHQRRGYWMARCPMPDHDDHEPSLKISYGNRRLLLLHCFGCNASFEELLGAIVGRSFARLSSRDSCSYSYSYLRGRDVVTNLYLELLRRGNEQARIGIDASAVSRRDDLRDLVVFEHPGLFTLGYEFEPGLLRGGKTADFIVRVPKRAGPGMVETLVGFVSEANRRQAQGWDKPLVYGSWSASDRLGVTPSTIRSRVKALERNGVVEWSSALVTCRSPRGRPGRRVRRHTAWSLRRPRWPRHDEGGDRDGLLG